MGACTLIILTYKGKRHLEFLMPTVKAAVDNYKGNDIIDVLVVDNGCDEPTRKFVIDNYPQYRYVFSPVNDYLFSLNPIIQGISSEYILMLNDDMKLDVNILNELIPVISKDQSLFAVSCRIMDFDGTYTASAVRQAKYSKGWMYHYYLDTSENEIKYTLYPGGGAAIFRTAYFNQLGGFDELYRPAYNEDTDIGIRAWQHGWKVIYHPDAILFHREGGTINEQFKKDRIEQMINRNNILWMVKNVRFPGFLFWFLLLLPFRLLKSKNENPNLYIGLKNSLSLITPLILKRKSARGIVVKDKNWLAHLNEKYVYKAN